MRRNGPLLLLGVKSDQRMRWYSLLEEAGGETLTFTNELLYNIENVLFMKNIFTGVLDTLKSNEQVFLGKLFLLAGNIKYITVLQ